MSDCCFLPSCWGCCPPGGTSVPQVAGVTSSWGTAACRPPGGLRRRVPDIHAFFGFWPASGCHNSGIRAGSLSGGAVLRAPPWRGPILRRKSHYSWTRPSPRIRSLAVWVRRVPLVRRDGQERGGRAGLPDTGGPGPSDASAVRAAGAPRFLRDESARMARPLPRPGEVDVTALRTQTLSDVGARYREHSPSLSTATSRPLVNGGQGQVQGPGQAHMEAQGQGQQSRVRSSCSRYNATRLAPRSCTALVALR